MPEATRVVQIDLLFEDGTAGSESQLAPPLSPVDLIDVADPDRSAAVRMLHRREIDRRHRHPVMRDGEVELDPERSPGSAVADERLLDGGIRVEHLLSAALVEAAVDVATE